MHVGTTAPASLLMPAETAAPKGTTSAVPTFRVCSWNTCNIKHLLQYTSETDETITTYSCNTCAWPLQHMQHPGKNTYNLCLKQLKHLRHAIATCVYSQCNICNIQINTCNIHLKQLKHLKHTLTMYMYSHCNICNTRSTFTISRWNVYNIHMKRKKYTVVTCAYLPVATRWRLVDTMRAAARGTSAAREARMAHSMGHGRGAWHKTDPAQVRFGARHRHARTRRVKPNLHAQRRCWEHYRRFFCFLALFFKILSNMSLAERFQKMDPVLCVIYADAKVTPLGAVGVGTKPPCHLADDDELAVTWQPPWRHHRWRQAWCHGSWRRAVGIC
jgi:hypothetical protein